jgi:ubiquinone biosynthesis monooxygenase Coq7
VPDLLDRLLIAADAGLRTLSGSPRSQRASPAADIPTASLDERERRHAAALMRVNHVGEVCAQALYQAQALTARSERLRAQMATAAREEQDHLAWTEQRLHELNDRPSLLNPLWYAGAFAIGLAAGRAGDRWSLGFVVETERQVEAHLASHLERLPAHDSASRAIVERMRDEEIEHARRAEAAGGLPLPAPVRWAMRGAARIMTATAHRI